MWFLFGLIVGFFVGGVMMDLHWKATIKTYSILKSNGVPLVCGEDVYLITKFDETK